MTLHETLELLIENDPVEGSDLPPGIEIGLEQNHPAADGGMEGTYELHENDDTQRMRRMMCRKIVVILYLHYKV